MRKSFLLFLLFVFASCQCEEFWIEDRTPDDVPIPIDFFVGSDRSITKSGQCEVPECSAIIDGSPFNVECTPLEDVSYDACTKVTPVTTATLNNFNLCIIKNDKCVSEQNVVFEKSGDIYSASNGLWWPSTNPSYDSFIASNVTINNRANYQGKEFYGYVIGNCSSDVVVAVVNYPEYKTRSALGFNHILARLGTLSLSAPVGYTATMTSASINCCRYCWYHLSDNWYSYGEKADYSLSSNNDFWVVPGTDSLSVTYDLNDGVTTRSVTESGTVSIQKGYLNNISISVNVTEKEIDLPGTFTVVVGDTIKTLSFTRGNLKAYMNAAGTAVEKWTLHNNQYDYIGKTTAQQQCKGGWMDLFGWTAQGKYSDGVKQYGINTSRNDSDYTLGGTDDVCCDWGSLVGSEYSVLSGDGWQYLIDHNMVKCADGTTMTHTIAGITCIILKPDGYTGTVADSYTASEWEAAEDAGLVALPCAGYRDGSFVDEYGVRGYYWSLTPDNVTGTKSRNMVCSSTSTYTTSFIRSDAFAVRPIKVLSKTLDDIVRYNYRNVTVSISASPTIIPAYGGVSTLTYTASYQQQAVYRSGRLGDWTTKAAEPASINITGSATGFTRNGTKVTVAINDSEDLRSVTYYANFSIEGVAAAQKTVTISQKKFDLE